MIDPRTCDDCKYRDLTIDEAPCIFCKDLNLPPYAMWEPEDIKEVTK